jgi:hypothetical protein
VSEHADLLDPVLVDLLGPVDEESIAAITGICYDALHAVLGPVRAAAVQSDPALMTRIAPWARDLARGLQFQARTGAGDPPTEGLLALLAGRPLTESQVRQFAQTVDLSVVLTLSHLTDQVLGLGSGARNPAVNETAAPWLAALKLGYRVGLVLELLRLTLPG